MIPKEKWEWFGLAGHFILGHKCQFHLCTKVGRYLVSTVGQLVALEGIGDDREADYMKKIGYEEIGCGRTFETMVFKAGKRCRVKDCMCLQPSLASSEKDFEGYNTAGEAQAGHLKMCLKWAEKQR